MDDIRYDIDNGISKDIFDEWYWKTLEQVESGLIYINYQSYCKGLKGPSDEDMQKLKEAKKSFEFAQELFNKTLNEIKEK